MSNILIIANGDVNTALLSRIYRRYSRIICADGGTRFALDLHITPDLVVGDLDSLEERYRDILLGGGYNLDLHPVDKDASDLELALVRAVESKPSSIDILGGWGSRWDHSLMNLHLLARFTAPGTQVSMLDSGNSARAALPGMEVSLKGRPGDLISLIPLSPRVSGVRAGGLTYPLEGRDLLFGSSLPVSNRLVGQKGWVRVEEGILLVLHHFETFSA